MRVESKMEHNRNKKKELKAEVWFNKCKVPAISNTSKKWRIENGINKNESILKLKHLTFHISLSSLWFLQLLPIRSTQY